MEKDNNQRVADQREVIRDLQQKMSQSQDENEKKSLQLKIEVAQAKLKEYENAAASDVSTSNNTVNEETPQNTKQFHNDITDEMYEEYVLRDYNTRRFLNSFGKFTDRHGAQRYYSKEQANKSAKALKSKGIDAEVEELKEGCMTKKFENMTNREVASYIFNHPHTKFASKMKECDDKEIMKAIRDIKKANEDAPVTNTSAVASAPKPSMYMKRPEPEELQDNQ